jgi:hypothetical protein
MRVRLVLVTAVLTAFSLVVAGPASAAAVTKRDVVRSLLTPRNLSEGWHKTDLGGSGPGADVQGCESGEHVTTGRRHKATRDFQYADTPTYITEEVGSFWTRRAARRDFNKSVKGFTACPEFTMDGRTFRVTRLSVDSYADQIAAFRVQGSVATADGGEVPLTAHLVATRWGRQTTVLTTLVGGEVPASELSGLKTASVRIGKRATAKVAQVLGR